MTLFRSRPNDYKSSDYEIKRNLTKSRNRQRKRAKNLRAKVGELEAEIQRLRRELQQAKEQVLLIRQLSNIETGPSDGQGTAAIEQPLAQTPIVGHSFPAAMVALCINLAKQIGFRPAARALRTVARALKLDIKIPKHDTIRNWAKRVGVAELKDTFCKDQAVLWMADHSSQIGAEKVLLIIGIALEDLPEPGQTLSFDKVKVLAIVPGKHWKKEDVGRVYQTLAEQIGAPRYLLSDGAVELREPAETLEKDGQPTIVLGDFKHFAANVLEKEIGRSERFREFITQVGLSRNRTQQTELSHFAPPPLKQKSRFMNLSSLLRWANMVIYHLSHPESEARVGVSEDRMNEKLGWLREYGEDFASWSVCQEVIDASLSFINHEGLSAGTSERLRAHLAEVLPGLPGRDATAGRVQELLMGFVEHSEQKLHQGERSWLSTEILESLFGRFKQLEGQQSKGGFTGLLACLPTFCCPIDPERIRRRLLEVSTPQLMEWVRATIGPTLNARRTVAYKESVASANGYFFRPN